MTNEMKSDVNQPSVPKKENKKGQNDVSNSKRWYHYQYRLIPIWLRIVLLLLFWIIIAIVGAMIGFSVLGDGRPFDVLKWETWQHIFDIMNGKE